MVDGDVAADVIEDQASTPLRPASTTAAASAILLFVFLLGQRDCMLGDAGNSPSSFNESSLLYRQVVSCISLLTFSSRAQSIANEVTRKAADGGLLSLHQRL